jgi:hypothetical protein
MQFDIRALRPEDEEKRQLAKRIDRGRYFDMIASAKVQDERAPGTRRYTTQFNQVLHTPAGLSELQSHKTAQHMAVGLLDPFQRAAYEDGTLEVFVVDELGRKHRMMHAAPGAIGVKV